MNNSKINLLKNFFEGNASLYEKQQLNVLLDDPSVFDNWLEGLWNNSDNQIDERVEKKMYAEIQQTHRIARKISYTKIWNVAAAVLVLFSCAFALYYRNMSAYARTGDNSLIVSVDKGQKANIVLPDGTKVWLNSDTELSYGEDFNQKKRVVNLSGEAYFEVAKKQDAPFTVRTEGLDVTALGTAFNVKAYEKDANVQATLINGSVSVKTKLQTRILIPNQRLVLDKTQNKIIIYDESDAIDYTAWMNNMFTFNNSSFESIANELERQYNLKFVFEDEALKKIAFNGSIPNNSLESLLEAFSLTSPLSYYVNDSTVILKLDRKKMEQYKKIVY